jgi:DNA-binding transcriptional LysR family regulator
MDHMKAIESFVMAAKEGSFAEAARNMRVSRAIISKRVKELEERLGVRLFHRNTRKVSLTATGQHYLDVCSRTLRDLEDEEDALASLHNEPRGTLKIVAVRAFGARHLAGAVADFVKLYPDLRIQMELTHGSQTASQLVQHGFDLGIGMVPAPQSDAVTRRLTTFDWVLCASPEYLEEHGTPTALKELADHRGLANQRHAPTGIWVFSRNGKLYPQKISVVLAISNVWSLREAALRGSGIALLPSFCVVDDVREGRLISLLKQYSVERGTIYTIYPHFRMIPTKVRLFTKFLKRRFAAGFSSAV